MERRKLFNNPAFEKVEIATYLVNNLTLEQMLSLENLVKTGKLKQIINEQKGSEQQVNNKVNNITNSRSKANEKYL